MTSSAATNARRPLSLIERRVLGVLVEKQKTTDTYPLSLNALTVGCNQKSNRHPVLDLREDQVEETLEGLRRDGFVTQVIGGRVDKWKHRLYEAWGVSGVELAILAELLLRGPQTEGELRGHTSRMEPIADLESLRSHLNALAQRGLVVYLTEPGRRGTVVTHGFHDPAELEQIRSRQPALPEETSPQVDPHGSGLGELRATIDQMRWELEQLRSQVQRILAELGLDSRES